MWRSQLVLIELKSLHRVRLGLLHRTVRQHRSVGFRGCFALVFNDALVMGSQGCFQLFGHMGL